MPTSLPAAELLGGVSEYVLTADATSSPPAPLRRLPQMRAVEGGAQVRQKSRAAGFGLWLRDHQPLLVMAQWCVVAVYAVLVIVPAMLPLPDPAGHIWSNFTRMAQFAIWGLWWPGLLLSVLVFGRLWCGALCPEGALTAFASRHGQGRAIPHWVRWPGWPFASFAFATICGQMISVYDYPISTLVILGGSTLASLIVGFRYGRNKRVWCRYLCPVNGLLACLSKLAPMHFAVDTGAWDACPPDLARSQRFTCEPMVPVRTMESASPCHMCGRCAGFRKAVTLSMRLPGVEVVTLGARTGSGWGSLFIIVGLIGLAPATFQSSVSPWFGTLKQALALVFVALGARWPQAATESAPAMTTQTAHQGLATLLDGAAKIGHLVVATGLMSALVALPLVAATLCVGPWTWWRFHHLAQCLIPLAAAGLILGATIITVTLLQAEGWEGPVTSIRIAILLMGAGWSAALTMLVVRRYTRSAFRRAVATGLAGAALLPPLAGWSLLFWVW